MTRTLTTRYARSPQWRDGQFRNSTEVPLGVPLRKIPSLLYKQLSGGIGRMPEQPLPLLPFDRDAFLQPDGLTRYVWYGHAAVLMRMSGQTLFIDPMMGDNASPIAPFKTRRFADGTLDVIADLPPIDAVLYTHDHYDHLDLSSVRRLRSRVKRWIVMLGVGRHLVRWGIPESAITELDWWEQTAQGPITIHATPTQHFAGRGPFDRAKSLWGGFVMTTPTERVYFSGDGGYGDHFKAVGERLGPFDFGMMECGQYNENWRPLHLFPDESVQAAHDAGVRIAMPFHWGGFSLAQHSWQTPVVDFLSAADAAGLPVVTPRLGEVFAVQDRPTTRWWESL